MRVKVVTAALMLAALCATPLASAMRDSAQRVFDGAPPVVTVPGDITREATSSDGASVSFSVDFSDPDGDIASSGCDHNPAGETYPVGTTVVTCSATDATGLSDSKSFNITVTAQPPPADTTAPTISTPGNFSVEATSGAGASVGYSVSANDPDDAVASLSCSPASGSTFPLGGTTVTCNASDSNGNNSSASFTITVVDTTGPVISNMPGNITTEATSASGAAVTYSSPSATDAVTGGRTVSCSPASGSTFSITTTTVTCSASDGNGNSSTASFSVTVRDTTPPNITVPADITVDASSPGGATVNYSASATDNVTSSPTISCTKGSGTTFPIGTTNVSCTAMDSAGNTSATESFNVTVADRTDPVLTVPGPITVEATSGSGAPVSFSATATDNVDSTPSVNCSPGSGSTFGLGTTTVSCTASDDSGNTSSAKTFTVKVQDTTAPTVTVPGNLTVGATGTTAFVSFTVTASDAVDSSPAITCSKSPAGATYPFGTTHVTCTAKDDSNNTSATAGFDVTVQDLTAPTLTVPSSFNKEATSSTGAVVTFNATATDAIDPTPTVTCDHPTGSTFPIGVTHVSCTAKDDSNNVSAPGLFDVTVADNTAPTLTVPASFTVSAPGPGGAVVSYSASATDAVDSSPTVICSKASGTTFPLGPTTVSCTAKDSSNNFSAAKSFTVTVADQTPPTVDGHAPITVEATSGSGAAVSFVVTASDVIDPSPAVTCSKPSGSTFPLGTTTVSCTAKDGSGNTSGAMTFDVTVRDTTAPVLSNMPADITTEANGPAGSKVNFSPPTAVDIVDGPIPSVPCSPAPGSTFPLGTTTVTCSATDARGNRTQGTMTVKVVDTTPPIIIAPGDTSVYATTDTGSPDSDGPIRQFIFGSHAADIADPNPKVTANNPQFFGVGTTVVTFTATDASGNKASDTAKLTVLPKPAPGTTPPPLPPPADNKPPANPKSVTAKAGDGRATLTWVNPTDQDFAYVEVTRTASPGTLSFKATGTVVYHGTGTSYTDRGLKNGTEYRYVIRSFDKNDNGSVGVPVVVFPKAALLLVPRDGAKLKKIPTKFTWKSDPKASYYNFQLYVGGSLLLQSTAATPKKVLSTWTNGPSLTFKSPWKWEGKSYKMAKGVYTWYVWPGYGARADVKYGPLMGSATFQLTVTPKPAKKAKKPKK